MFVNSRLAVLLFVISLTSCTAWLPQEHLYPEIERTLGHEIPDELLTENVYVVGFWEVQKECIGALGIVGFVGFPIMGCASLSYNANGHGYYCEIWIWDMLGADVLYEHEHKHCIGYGEW